MGGTSTDVLESFAEAGVEPSEAQESSTTAKRPSRRMIAVSISVVAALVVAGVGGVAWADRVAHDDAVAAAETARSSAAASAAGQRAAVGVLEASVADAIAVRDAVSAQVLPYEALLGGATVIAPVVTARDGLAAALVDELDVEQPTLDSVVPDAAPAARTRAVDPELGTDALNRMTAALVDESAALDADRAALVDRADALDDASRVLRLQLLALAQTLPAQQAALLVARPLASADAKNAAAAAVTAFDTADADTELPALLTAYAQAASTVIATHDTETARIAAEKAAAEAAAQAAAKSARRSGGGGASGGAVGGGSGVLGATNAARAANGIGALSGSGALNASSCSWAQNLASANGELSHSSLGGGVWAENVAYGYGSASAVVNGWMNSSGHRANILNPSYRTMGSCSATSATGRIYWVQQFGR